MSARHGGDLNKDNVGELVYLEQVLLETARLTALPISARDVGVLVNYGKYRKSETGKLMPKLVRVRSCLWGKKC